MLIDYKSSPRKLEFDKLNEGDVFLFNGRILLKTEGHFDKETAFKCNCVYLEDGTLHSLDADVEISPVFAKLCIYRLS